MSVTAQWTVMIFMAGDGNLSKAGDRDLAQMRRIGSTDAVNVLVEFHRADTHVTRRIYLQQSAIDATPDQPGATDASSADGLGAFIDWAARHYPARRYALILCNHGGTKSEPGRTFFRSTEQPVLAPASSPAAANCADDGSGYFLDTLELGRVLERGTRALGQPIDLLGMDACLMSNIEVAYQLRERARYVVASEDPEPSSCWPYARVLDLFAQQPEAATSEVAAGIVSACVADRDSGERYGNVIQTALDLSHLRCLTVAIDELADALIANMDGSYPVIWEAQRKSTRFAGNALWDIGQFCTEVARGAQDSRVVACAEAVVAAHAVGAAAPVVAFACRGSELQGCHGMSIYLVPPMKHICRYYRDLDFAANFHWLTMLTAYHEV